METPIERKAGQEFLDLTPDAYTADELQGSLEDLARINRHLGTWRAVEKHLTLLLAGRIWKKITILDIGTGLGDIPVALAELGRRTGMQTVITGVDNNRQAVEIARPRMAPYPEINVETADALNLPFAAGSFDIVLCSKLLHHLDAQDGVRLIREMLRVARFGYLLLDLRRSRVAWLLICLLTRLLTLNRLTRHDGPLSVLRSYTPAELARLAVAAGASGQRISKEPFWLMVLTGVVK